MATAQLRALLVARGIALPPSPTRPDIERLCAEHGISPGGRLLEDDLRGASPATPEEEKFALQRGSAAKAEALATRWRESRATLVQIACVLREEGLLHMAFRAWLGCVWERRLRSQAEYESHSPTRGMQPQQRPEKLLILTSLEEQRRRLMRMLHLAHLENRWHRQYLSRTVHHNPNPNPNPNPIPNRNPNPNQAQMQHLSGRGPDRSRDARGRGDVRAAS